MSKRIAWMLIVVTGCTGAFALPARGEVTFSFTFFDVVTGTGVGFDDPALGAARREALEKVGMEIGKRIGQTATVAIGVAPSEMDGTGPIGVGSATFLDTTAGIRDGEVYRRIVLGLPDTNPGLDAGMVFDFGYPTALSGTPGVGVAYFPDVARHELTHILGFGSFIKSNGTGFNGTTPDMYTRFDSLLTTDGGAGMGLPVVDAGGNQLLDMATFTAAHGSGLVFEGTETRAANGGAALKLFGADPTHSAAMTDVMFPSPAVGSTRDDWTDREAAVLKDLGYLIIVASTTPTGGTATTCGACAPISLPFAGGLTLCIAGMKRRRR